jgi:hypothetical protein
MSAHTPGPWKLVEYHMAPADVELARKHGIDVPVAMTNDGQRYITADSASDRTRIALVDSMTDYKRGKGHEVQCAERDANARLIAAAPQLLEVADCALNVLIGCCVPAGGADDRKMILETIQQLRAAIAKATASQATAGGES